MKLFTQNQARYGLGLTGLVIICLILMEITGNNASFETVPFYQFLIQAVASVAVLVAGIMERKKILGGIMSWKQGLAEGFKISLLFAITSPFIFLAYYLLVNSEILASVRIAYQMAADSSNGEVIFMDMLFQAVTAIIFGTAVSAIASFFIRSKGSAQKA